MRLRTCEGIVLAEMEAKFGAARKAQFLRQLQRVRSDLYRRDGAAVRLTEAGLLFADAVAEELFAEEGREEKMKR